MRSVNKQNIKFRAKLTLFLLMNYRKHHRDNFSHELQHRDIRDTIAIIDFACHFSSYLAESRLVEELTTTMHFGVVLLPISLAGAYRKWFCFSY